jgi:hypothetical protein
VRGAGTWSEKHDLRDRLEARMEGAGTSQDSKKEKKQMFG